MMSVCEGIHDMRPFLNTGSGNVEITQNDFLKNEGQQIKKQKHMYK